MNSRVDRAHGCSGQERSKSFAILGIVGVAASLSSGCSGGTTSDTPATGNAADRDGGPKDPRQLGPEPPAEIKGPFDLNDVSILFPLPPGGQDQLLRPDEAGGQGVLIPKDLYATLPSLSPFQVGPSPGSPAEDKANEYAGMRAVAMRIDPCFPSLALPSNQCKRQIRLVFQPVSTRSWASAADQAVHAFYELPSVEFDKFAAQLSALKADAGVSTTGQALGIHPAIKAQGLEGKFAKGLFAAMLPKIGASRLTRITQMALPQDGAEWKFQGFDIVNGAAKAIQISGTRSTEQSFHIVRDRASIVPEPKDNDNFRAFLEVSSVEPTQKPAADLVADALGATLRIENPTKHTAESVSCVSCHAAGPSRRLAETSWGVTSSNHPDAFSSAFNLALTLVPAPTNARGMRELRSFGYRDVNPIVNQRVINESAAVAAYLNQQTTN